MIYKCSNCKLAVIVINGEVFKACNCNAPIMAEMSATAQSVSSMGEERICQDLQQSLI